MAAKERIFFAGVGTTFAILAIGFGGGLLMAGSAVHDTAVQKRISAEPPARVVLPSSAEPALQVTAAAPQPEPSPIASAPAVQVPQVSPAIQADHDRQAERDRQIERDRRAEREKAQRAERRKAELEKRRRYAEAKARRLRQEQDRQQQEARQQQPRVLAFDADGEQPKSSFPSLFGN